MRPRAEEHHPEPAAHAPQFEVIPVRGIADEVATHLPSGARITITASPAQGLAATIDVAGALSQRGFHAVPHLAARMIRGVSEAEEILGGLAAAGVAEVFVIAGDAPRPAGDFPGALALLEAVTAVGSGMRVGIGAHPEGHPFADEAEAMRLLRAKAEHASYAVTQMCFESAPLLTWTRELRAAGITLPVRPGIAVPVSTARLLRIGARIGVGRSLRLLTDADSGVRHLFGPTRWEPAPLLAALEAAAAAEPELALWGPHLYTFNALSAARECAVGR